LCDTGVPTIKNKKQALETLITKLWESSNQNGLKDISIPFNWENERDAGLEKLLISFSI